MASHLAQSIEDIEEWARRLHEAAGVLRWLMTTEERSLLARENETGLQGAAPIEIGPPRIIVRPVPAPRQEAEPAPTPEPAEKKPRRLVLPDAPKRPAVDKKAQRVLAAPGSYDEPAFRQARDHPGIHLSQIAKASALTSGRSSA
jgi:hypothetical protein